MADMRTPAQAAEFLGLSRSKMYDLAASGKLPSYRFDSALHFLQADLEAYKASCRSDMSWTEVQRRQQRAEMAAAQEAAAEAARATRAQMEMEGAETRAKALAARHSKAKEARRVLVLFHSNKRRAEKLKRTPAWADQQAIRTVYDEAARLTQETGEAHHVDHIIPLQGKLVSGLHVANNLQVLHWRQNVLKRNRFEVEA